jgi:glyoxylase-like metal-dependent hydrolase (beta-lactamase superfamily II)/rhodanese-related sulfurtransferase
MITVVHCVLIVGSASALAAIEDAEAPTHGDRAATYELIQTYEFPGFKVLQFKLAVLSHYSFMLISKGEALLVDPGRDVFSYLDTAKKEGAAIHGVFLTHSHADFVAGHLELAHRTNCPIYVNRSSKAEFPFKPFTEGSTLRIGDATLKFIETPGHTPDGLCAYVYGSGKKREPDCIFTGDTLFVGSVGRPDLLEGTMSAAGLASMMFDTWTNKLSKAGDNAVIFPAHGAGSLCGAHLSDSPSSTIGAEKMSNPYFTHSTRSEFIAAVLEGLPEAPQYFAHNATMNRVGPELVDWNARLPSATAPDRSLTDPTKYDVVDVRSPKAYAAGHIPGSVNIGVRGRFENWVGTMVPWNANLILCGSEDELTEALYRLHRVGYHAGVISLEQWQKAGMPVATSALVKPSALHRAIKDGTAPVIVDVRLPSEWTVKRIGSVVNLPLTHLAELSGKLDPAQPLLIVCNSGYRSSMAAGILQRKGFTKVSSLDGGSDEWEKAGLPVYGDGAAKEAPPTAPAPAVPMREIRLPERISPSDLSRMIIDLPGTFELVDIRPPAQFADYSIPGSKNVAIAELMENPAYLAGTMPLVIVDRDDSLAMAVAGMLCQKTRRPIKVLYGGLRALWQELMSEAWLGAPAVTGAPATAPGQPAEIPPVPGAAPKAPEPPKKKSAGC